ncbi:uncharacterized protein [Anabrus simplex]|uniref:uncharacterized protein n=1 Tax=Anabrus simplex TaxID=316456 RepID=UPI0035A279F2
MAATSSTADIDPSYREALLNLLLSELAEPTANHVNDYMRAELGSSRPHILGSLLAVALQEPQNVESDVPEVDQFETLLASSDSQFEVLFRMKRATVENLITVIEKSLADAHNVVAESVPVKKKVLLTCWLMGNTEQYSSASGIFGIKNELIHPIFVQICHELCVLSGRYIFWPSLERCGTITKAFEDQYGFPGVIGAIGSVHISIKRPVSEDDPNQFLNNKLNIYTTVMQAVCDDKMIFQNVCVGFPGRCSPSQVLVGSPLYSRLVDRTNPLIEPHKHILGSSSYPQLPTLLTPYSGAHLNDRQKKFNTLHDKARSIIDKSFKILKARFCRLQHVDISELEVASKVILAGCVLHNFALSHGDEFHIAPDAEINSNYSLNYKTVSHSMNSSNLSYVEVEH